MTDAKKYTYAYALWLEHSSSGAKSMMLFKTERKAKKSATDHFPAAKGWETRIEKLVVN